MSHFVKISDIIRLCTEQTGYCYGFSGLGFVTGVFFNVRLVGESATDENISYYSGLQRGREY